MVGQRAREPHAESATHLISKTVPLTLTLSHPMGEGTGSATRDSAAPSYPCARTFSLSCRMCKDWVHGGQVCGDMVDRW